MTLGFLAGGTGWLGLQWVEVGQLKTRRGEESPSVGSGRQAAGACGHTATAEASQCDSWPMFGTQCISDT